MEKPLATLPVLFTLQLITLGLIRHGAALDVDTPLLNQDVVVPDGYTPFPNIGVAYKPFYKSLNFESARKHCIAEGGNLAVIDSSNKVKYAKSLAPLGDMKYFFVGIHKYSDDSEWVSIKTGSPLTYIPWKPNDSGNKAARCVGLVTSQDGLQLFSCELSFSYICEVPIQSRPSEISNKTIVGDVRVSMTFENTSLVNHAVAVPDGYTAFPDIGVAYKYFSHNLTWSLARKHCITEGGNLAVIDSFKKREYANSKVSVGSLYPFVGLHKLFDNSEWVSVRTGLPLEFVPWKGGSIQDDTTKSCAALWTTGVTPSSCSAHGSHICEIPLFTTSQTPRNVTDPGVPCGVHTQSPKSATELPSGYTVYTHLGVAYKFYGYQMTWNEARKYCASHGANLAVIDSYEKFQHVIELRGADTKNVGVGAHRLFDHAEWVDVRSGSPAIAIPWRSENHVDEASRACMVLTTYEGDHGLYAGSCTLARRFVCEVSIFRD